MSDTALQDSHTIIHRLGPRVEIKMTSNAAALRPVRLALEEFAHESGLAASESDKVGLVLNEALANVIRHGYGGAADKPIELTFERIARPGKDAGASPNGELVVRIRDWAKPFDPATLPSGEPPTDPDKIKPGGLGILCMRRWMDQLTYTPLPDGMLLTMVKKIGKG
jgi:serine/threonine-protein kinase RsbW